MKPSKLMHVGSALVGFIGVVVFIATLVAREGASVFGVAPLYALLYSIILLLIAIWSQIATIHHMMLEKRGDVI